MRAKSAVSPSKNTRKLRIVEEHNLMKIRLSPQSAILAGFSGLLTLPTPLFASNWGILIDGIEGCNFQTGWLTPACIPNFIGHLITFVYGFIGIFFMLNVMYAGYQLAIAYIGVDGADKGAGKDRLKWSIAGLILSSCIYLILDLVLTVVLGPPS